MAEGVTFLQTCQELDLGKNSLRNWMKKHPPQAFHQVAVESPPGPSQISLVLPNGIRFEGLDIDNAVAIAKRFR